MTSTPTADSDDGLNTIEPRSSADHGDEPSVLETHSNTVPSSHVHHSFPPLLDDIGAVGMVEEDIALMSKICSKIEQLSETDRLRPQLVILYSDHLCPILKFHTELFTEMIRVLTSIFNCDGGTDHPSHEGSPPNLLAMVVSPTSDAHVKVMLAQPFQLDLLDRVRLAHIQVENASPELQRVLIVDDSWARLKARNSPVLTWRSTEAHKEHYALSLTHECHRLVSLLACITASSRQPLGPLEALCVLDQSECERYGVPSGIGGKVIFLITKDREERPKSVALRTCIHWIDRMFQRSGYTLEWTHANVIPLYVELPGSAALNLAGQREESVYAGVGIQLSGKRPLEACARIKVREGEGGEVLEASVLEEVERTKMFEAQVIPRLHFEELMGNMSLECGEAARSDKDQDEASSDDMEDDNPFL